MPQSDQAYLLAEDSEFESVEVDDQVVSKYGEGTPLTEDQVNRVNEVEGVELVSAEQSQSQESEQAQPDQAGEE